MGDANSTNKNLKPYSITDIKTFVPLILDLNQLNYNDRRVLFETHWKACGVVGHHDGTSILKDNNDKEWDNLDYFVYIWIYDTLTQSIPTMVLKISHKAQDVWKALEDLFRYNKDTRAIEIENELRPLWFSVITPLWSIVKILMEWWIN